MKLTTSSTVPVYTIAGSDTARPLPDWLVRKRKRSLKSDPSFANRVELLQDFAFEEASRCIQLTKDGQSLMSTGTYKPQIHVHNLQQLSLSYTRHTDVENVKFLFLGDGPEKSLHLQSDRTLQLQGVGAMHYSTRLPRYGRDLKFESRTAEGLVGAVGINTSGYAEVYRLNLEVGRFMKSYEVDVGEGSDTNGYTLQGGIDVGGVNAVSAAEQSHGLLAFGTSIGTVELWDSRVKQRVGTLSIPAEQSQMSAVQDSTAPHASRSPVSVLEFHSSGLILATGTCSGITYLHDLRSPHPLLRKDQGYGYPIQNISFLPGSQLGSHKILSADKRIIKIWEQATGAPWTSIEPAVDLHDVAWVPNSGMLLTANEGPAQHIFFMPALGPAPSWCGFLDNIVEEMAEGQLNDPSAYSSIDTSSLNSSGIGSVYDNYKFLTLPQLRAMNMDHLIGTTHLLRPYMHGWFVAQRLYEEARIIANPFVFEEERLKRAKEKIDQERESRIRSTGKNLAITKLTVNKRLAERMMRQEDKEQRRAARAALTPALDDSGDANNQNPPNIVKPTDEGVNRLDPRFASLFQDEDFIVDETSREFQLLNPSTRVNRESENISTSETSKRKTAVEEEEDGRVRRGSGLESLEAESSDGSAKSEADDEDDLDRAIRSQRARRPQQPKQEERYPRIVTKKMRVIDSTRKHNSRDHSQVQRSFGDRVDEQQRMRGQPKPSTSSARTASTGDKEISFEPERNHRFRDLPLSGGDRKQRKDMRGPDRRRASGNVLLGR